MEKAGIQTQPQMTLEPMTRTTIISPNSPHHLIAMKCHHIWLNSPEKKCGAGPQSCILDSEFKRFREPEKMPLGIKKKEKKHTHKTQTTPPSWNVSNKKKIEDYSWELPNFYCSVIWFPSFLNSVRIPSVKYRLGQNCPDASWKARSIRRPLEEGWRASGGMQPMPREQQGPSQVSPMSSVSVASWNAVTLESISHYPPVNSPLCRFIFSPLKLHA